MNVASEHQRIEEDLSRVQALLEKLPPSRVLERIGFEARRDELMQALGALEPGSAATETPAARMPPEPTESAGSGRLLIEEALSEVETLLARLPENRVLERASLEARREELREELAKSEIVSVKEIGAAVVDHGLARFVGWVLSGTTVLTLAALLVAFLGASSLRGVLGVLLTLSLGLNLWSVLRVRSLGSAAQTTRAPQPLHRPRAS